MKQEPYRSMCGLRTSTENSCDEVASLVLRPQRPSVASCNKEPVLSGDSQGSVQGPMLFIDFVLYEIQSYLLFTSWTTRCHPGD